LRFDRHNLLETLIPHPARVHPGIHASKTACSPLSIPFVSACSSTSVREFQTSVIPEIRSSNGSTPNRDRPFHDRSWIFGGIQEGRTVGPALSDFGHLAWPSLIGMY
jgi:hypothetical protein